MDRYEQLKEYQEYLEARLEQDPGNEGLVDEIMDCKQSIGEWDAADSLRGFM